LNVVNATPSVAFAGGAVVKINLKALAGVTVNTSVPCAPLSAPVVSVAVNVHEDPTLIDIPVKIATSDPFVTSLVTPVVNGHVEATLMLSPDAAAVTVKPKVVPACAVAVPPNISGASADAGDTATNARPASIRADVAPIATNDFNRVLKERWPTLRFAEFIIGFPPLHFPSGLNA
jgi:hypothetical protein